MVSATAGSGGVVEFRILGPLEVVAEAGPVVLPQGRARSLLALLILRAGEVVSTERLIDELWGQTPPPTATTALHGLVSALRRRLEPARRTGQAPAVLQTRPPGYVLAVDRGQVDANRFRHLVEGTAGAPPQQRAALLREALGWWRGPALAEFTYEPFAQTAITALSELRLRATEERIEADLALGRHAELVGELEGLVAEHPLRERLRAQLMLALYRCGRQAEALDVYGDARRTLVDELGIEPGPVLRSLEQAVLRQDATLDPQPVSYAPGITAGPSDLEAAGAQSWLTQSRKTVTVVFVDVAEAAVTAGGSDPEASQRSVGRGVDVAGEVLTRHGATVEGIIGDVVVAVFGVPVAHEDDALRGVRAAIELSEALATLNAQLEHERRTRLGARIGVNTGEVVIGDPGTHRAAASGDTVRIAARLQQAAGDGEVLIGEATRRLLDDAVVVEPVDRLPLDGRIQTDAWRLVAVVSDPPTRIPDFEAPMVDRADELRSLRTIFDRVLREQRAELVTVVGEPGVGKSRLALEFASALEGEAQILTGHCPSYGEGITFWPLREIVLEAAGGSRPDGVFDLLGGEDDRRSVAAQVAGAIGLSEDTGSAFQLFPAVRRFVEALAGEQALVLILDDVHWAQPTFLDLLEYLAESAQGAVLLLCLGRPEVLEHRGSWAQRHERLALLHLQPLGPDDSSSLVTERLTGRVLSPGTIAQVVDTAQGNPLFVEQLVAALRDEGERSFPPSLQALVAARLDRLGSAERDLLRCASVVGVDFPVQALTALVPDQARPFVDRHLRTLQDKELIRPSRRPFLGAEASCFGHVLIQRAAYRSMTRHTRAELHERFARWLQADAGTRILDLEEVVGYHLEQAHAHRRGLGLADQHTRTLALRAGEHLARAGLRAYARFDVSAAENLWSRAGALLPPDHCERPRVNQRLVEAYQLLGRHADADAVLAEMLAALGADGSPALEHVIRIERARIRLFTGPDPLRLDAIRAEAAQACRLFKRAGDEAGLALACFVLGYVHLWRGRPGEMERVARQGLAHAERSGEPREKAAARVMVALALVAGETPIPDCLRECARLTPWLGMEHPLLVCQMASLRAMLGQFDDARELIVRARRLLVERLRARRPQMFAAGWSAEVEILAGDLAAGEGELRTALDMALNMREREWVCQFAAHLSRLSSMRGTAEAERFARLSVQAAPTENVTAQALSRAATAGVLAGRGDHRQAERLARDAAHLPPPAMLNLRAHLHVDLAEVLLATGQREAAMPAIGQATDLYERKGHLVGAAQARALGAEIAQRTGRAAADRRN